MKILSTSTWIILAILACVSGIAHAEGTRGGGEASNAGRTYTLRDAVDPTSCEWKTGGELFADTPELARVLASVAKLDWYFAFDLERRIRGTSYCMTRFLAKVRTSDDPACRMTDEYGDHVRFAQAAVYTEDDGVFVDRAIFASLASNAQRALLLVHEAMHSYIPWDCRHNSRLRDMVKAVSDIYENRMTRPSQLYLTMNRDAVAFPQNAEKLSGLKEYLLAVLSPYSTFREVLLGSAHPADLFVPKIYPPSDALLDDDYQRVVGLTAESLVAPACDARDREVISFLAGRADTANLDAPSICLLRGATKDFADFLAPLVNLDREFEALLDQVIAAKRVVASENRLMIGAGISDLTVTPADGRPLRPITELVPIDGESWKGVPARIRAVASILASLAAQGQIDQVAAATARSPKFYAAFSVLDAEASIDVLPVLDSRERPMAKEALRDVFSGFVTAFVDQLGDEASRRLKTEIDWKKLGYGPNDRVNEGRK